MHSKRLDLEDFHFEAQRLASQRVVEVDSDLIVVERLDHAGQLSISRIVEDHQQAFGQFHVLELRTRDELTKGVFRQDLDGALVTGLEAEQRSLETGQQVAVPYLERGRRLVKGAVHGVAVLQAQGKVQGDFRILTDA